MEISDAIEKDCQHVEICKFRADCGNNFKNNNKQTVCLTLGEVHNRTDKKIRTRSDFHMSLENGPIGFWKAVKEDSLKIQEYVYFCKRMEIQ